MLTDDIAIVLREHAPNPPATPEDISAFERTHGFHLDPELRAFYAACNGARLFPGRGDPYDFLPLAKVARIGVDGERPPRPGDVFAFVRLQDSDHVGFRLCGNGHCAIVDMFHEEVWYEGWQQRALVIAPSLAEFLWHSLRHEGRAYWLDSPRTDKDFSALPPPSEPGRGGVFHVHDIEVKIG